jgi:hypothetical protein
MQVAKLIVRVVQLECPHCHQVVKASDGTVSIHADVADRWEMLAKHPLECMGCHRLFSLPASPFREKVR